jgi:ribonuclease HII
MTLPDFAREACHGGRVAGIDEAGRGPWAGPVVAAIVVLDPKRLPEGINDSKLLSRTRREALCARIMESAFTAVGICSVEEVDRYNILGATKLAMRRAYEGIGCRVDIALIDGNQKPDLPCAMEAIVDGDALCLSIAAASIVAKVTRDRMMCELAVQFPAYGWERNAGYGTREHQLALASHGVTVHHRRSFAPIRKLMEQAA